MYNGTVLESDLNAYLDGELSPEEAAELETRIDEDAEAQDWLARLAAQKTLLSEALEALDPPVANLKTIALEKKLARRIASNAEPQRRGFHPGVTRAPLQIAAAIALVALGWWGHSTVVPNGGDRLTSGLQVAGLASAVPEYVSEAVGAHQVFAEDVERPVEFAGPSAHDAADYFSVKLGVPVMAPDLSGQRMQLVGARLLGTKEGPLVQYIYEDTTGRRVSLTLAKHRANTPTYALKVVDYPDRAVGYWTRGEIDYAVVSETSNGQVQSVITNLAQSF